MSAEPVEPPRRGFKNASPREIRAALVPDERAQFDEDWRAALGEATQSMDLHGVTRMLDGWRVHAAMAEDLGHAGYRRWLAEVERRSRTGERRPGSVPWSRLKAQLGL